MSSQPYLHSHNDCKDLNLCPRHKYLVWQQQMYMRQHRPREDENVNMGEAERSWIELINGYRCPESARSEEQREGDWGGGQQIVGRASTDEGYISASAGGGSTSSTDSGESERQPLENKQAYRGERWNSVSSTSASSNEAAAIQPHPLYGQSGGGQMTTVVSEDTYEDYSGRSMVMMPPMNVDAVLAREQDIRDQTRRQVIAELSQFASAIKTEGAPITINNMHQSHTNTMMNSSSGENDTPPRPKSSIEILADSVNRFFESPFNKACFVGITGVGLYLIYNYYTHKWREEELQRKIDANFLLSLIEADEMQHMPFKSGRHKLAGPEGWVVIPIKWGPMIQGNLGGVTEVEGGEHKVEGILARRVHEEDGVGDEYLIKWANEPYQRVSWYPADVLLAEESGAGMRIRKFEERHPRGVDKNVDFSLPSTSSANGDVQMQAAGDSPRRKRSGSAGSDNAAHSDAQAALLDELVDRGLIKEEWLQKERLLTFREDDGRKEWLVKWKGLQMTHATWEVEDSVSVELIDAWYDLNDRSRKNKLKCLTERPKETSEKWLKDFIDIQTDKDGSKKYVYKPTEDTLFDFQIEGVQWLLYNWSQRRGSILADEMGLGKTVQSSVFLSAVMKYSGGGGPCLVVAPLSTLGHWKRELQKWAPSLVTVLFHGNAEDRQLMMDYDMSWVNTDTGEPIFEKSSMRRRIEYKPKFDVMLMSYETLLGMSQYVGSFHWRLLIMDEGHRLKGVDSLAKQKICDRKVMKVDHHVLLTGTPIQNNLQELWSLLNVVDYERFDNWEEFEKSFSFAMAEGSQEKNADDLEHDSEQLQAVLQPYILRRHKTDVMKKVPPKEEVVIEVEFTRLQKKIYRSIYEKNVLQLANNQVIKAMFVNVSMELRKCCAHPYLIQGTEEAQLSSQGADTRGNLEGFVISDDVNTVMSYLVQMSGKMVFLEKLLPRLKQDGQKVLIFSQMTRMLDIIQDYLRWRG
ncbi:choline dehydrogenase 7 [Perkinsus chesapeaki]|uniref:Choline dehydrogenase 7 n=1 Tax=Perkinsus chesapeaki TaxID=330153 RepID=A0A7J6MDF0_PERCH|nr:choline dehydrogenase 7 [Perkinsus chesapeaki]